MEELSNNGLCEEHHTGILEPIRQVKASWLSHTDPLESARSLAEVLVFHSHYCTD